MLWGRTPAPVFPLLVMLDPRSWWPSTFAALLMGITTLGCSEEPESAADQVRWRLVFEGLPGALTSVAGTSASDIWFAGTDPGDGSGALVLHYDGSDFTRVDLSNVTLGSQVDLWWVRAFDTNNVFFGGTEGTIIKYDGDEFTRMETPGGGTVFGIWGPHPAKLWAVGGDPALEANAFIWKLQDGQSWSTVSNLPELDLASYFKVWGTSEDSVRVVGSDGIILNYDGSNWERMDSGVDYTLTTVHASDLGTYVAVGGFGDGLVLEDSGGGWQNVTPSEPPKQLFGVWLQAEQGYAVGSNGSMLRRNATRWLPEDPGVLVTLDLHAVWIDEVGGVWAVGGDLVSTPKVDGVLLHKGARPPVTSPEARALRHALARSVHLR